MSRILVTGGAGAIGFFLSKYLVEQHHEVYIVDNYIKDNYDQNFQNLVEKNGNAHEVSIDLCNTTLYEKLPKNIEYIYHLAALNGTQNFYERPFDVLLNSTVPTINILNHYHNTKSLKRFIYAGSSEAYASSVTMFNWPVPTAEDVPLGIADPLNVRWSYGGSKLHGELATIAAHNQFNIPFTIIRFHNVYGPRMGNKHVIPDFIERAKDGIYELYGYEDTRAFLYIDDAVEALVTCAESANTLNHIINVGGGQEITMLNLANIIMKLMGKYEEIKTFPSPIGSVKRRSPDLTKLKKLIGFEQKFSLEVGLKKTIDYYMK